MKFVGMDYETERFGPGKLAPPVICCAFSWRDDSVCPCCGRPLVGELAAAAHLNCHDEGEDNVARALIVRHEYAALRDAVWEHFRAAARGDEILVFHNAPYDTTVTQAEWPEMTPDIFAAYEAGGIHCTLLREQLLNLSLQGDLQFVESVDGTRLKIDYELAELEELYGVHFGVDRKKQKRGDDSLRNNYEQWRDLPLAEWPREAVDYPMHDAAGCLLVHERQQRRHDDMHKVDGGPRPSLATQEIRLRAAHALRLMSCMGMAVDLAKKAEIVEQLERELSDEKLAPLYEGPPCQVSTCRGLKAHTGILRRAVPGRPIMRKGVQETTKDTPASVCTKSLHAKVVEVCRAHDLEIKMTKGGEDGLNPVVSTDKEVMERVAPFDRVLSVYQHRQYLQKLVSTELPRLSGPVVHANYRPLVETGRTSSYGSKGERGEPPPYPSLNIQNVSTVRKFETLMESGETVKTEINVRHCLVARPGWVLCSCDFESIEFVAMAQFCWKQFGHSVMREVINGGHNPHDFLGAQLALYLDPHFSAAHAATVSGDKFAAMAAFKSWKNDKTIVGTTTRGDLYDKYRMLAKPVGFGFGGGLGAKKFIEFARKDPYRIVVSLDQAMLLKDIWLATYTEAPVFFDYVQTYLQDPWNSDDEGRSLFRYVSPLGLVRAGARYTAACNGAWLQTPAADGALLAVWDVVRACYDASAGNCLLGAHALAFVHDDIITELPIDDYMHERGYEQARIQIAAMKKVMPDVDVRCRPALQLVWDKKAETVHDSRGRLTIWTPEAA